MTDPVSQQEAELLRDAKAKAERLLAELILRRDEIERQPPNPKVDPEQYARGREAFANAIASAQRTLDAIDQALKLI